MTEQRIHHIVNGSNWDWEPVQDALVRHFVHTLEPQAWVVRPMYVPKSGGRSVGVELGQVRNTQLAFGVWAAAATISVPVSWRLHLSRAWLEDRHRRLRASIPDTVDLETPAECAVNAALDTVGRAGAPTRPVVLDARDTDDVATVQALQGSGVSMLVRVSDMTALTVADRRLTGHRDDVQPAAAILLAARSMMRPASWIGPSSVRRTCMVSAVRVRIPGGNPWEGNTVVPEGMLLGMTEFGWPWPGELWLTNMVAMRPAALARLTRPTQRVDEDFTRICDQAGVRDFSGRSFGGWYRHVTLASVAHAVAAVSAPRRVRAHPVRGRPDDRVSALLGAGSMVG